MTTEAVPTSCYTAHSSHARFVTQVTTEAVNVVLHGTPLSIAWFVTQVTTEAVPTAFNESRTWQVAVSGALARTIHPCKPWGLLTGGHISPLALVSNSQNIFKALGSWYRIKQVWVCNLVWKGSKCRRKHLAHTRSIHVEKAITWSKYSIHI